MTGVVHGGTAVSLAEPRIVMAGNLSRLHIGYPVRFITRDTEAAVLTMVAGKLRAVCHEATGTTVTLGSPSDAHRGTYVLADTIGVAINPADMGERLDSVVLGGLPHRVI